MIDHVRSIDHRHRNNTSPVWAIRILFPSVLYDYPFCNRNRILPLDAKEQGADAVLCHFETVAICFEAAGALVL